MSYPIARLLLTVSVLVSIFTVGLGYFNKGKFDIAKRTLANTQVNLATTRNILAQTQKDNAAMQKQLAEITAKLEQTSATLATTQNQLEKTSEQTTHLSNELAARSSHIQGLKGQTTSQENKIKELTAALQAGNSRAARETELAIQVSEQKTLTLKLQNQLDSAKTKIQEYRKKDIERQKFQMRLGLEGKILAVNQAWNFVVLSIGDKNGVLNNTEMLVKRGNQLIGKVRVTSVEPSSSIADILSSSLTKGQLVQTGDSVIYETTSED